MEQFPHLKFIQKVTGLPRLFGGGHPNEKSEQNKQDRQGHSNYLSDKTARIKEGWTNVVSERENQSLAPLDIDVVPIFLQLNPSLLTYDFDLKCLGIEIISEEDEGYIIGASLDGLRSLEAKINEFISEKHGSGIVADLWEIVDGNRNEWKPQHILSKELYAKWDKINERDRYNLEVSIAFDKPLEKEPDPDPTKRGWKSKQLKYRQLLVERDERLMQRESDFIDYIAYYGEIKSGLIDLDDSFGCEVEISGKGLKDLVFNYPFVFEVSEKVEIGGIEEFSEERLTFEFDVISPDSDDPEVCVIDSGIMENHKYIAPAIKSANSKSYIDGNNSTADHVQGGGHGTKVCGAILYPYGVTNLPSPYQLPCFIRNLRVLNDDNKLNNNYPAELMRKIIAENEDCTIFNLSINETIPSKTKHMSSWAATIDSLIHEKNVLFIISAGNIYKDHIQSFLKHGRNYPDFLRAYSCRIANPAQSSFALTVGSINHAQFEDDIWESLGKENEISAFSRIGKGIWGHIKPDVVEFGGGLIVSKNGENLVRENEYTSPELCRSTLHGGSAFGKDCTGTSFAAPKVTHIVAQLKKLYPDEDVNLLRALVVQGARLPDDYFYNPTLESIRYFGYGIPSIDRVTRNTDQRITFYNTGKISAEEGNIYSLQIPDELLSQANEYDILIEVTLAYTAKVRRTRQKTKSYLSTWLDWITSKIDEPFNDFKEYALKEIDENKTSYDKDARGELKNFSWKIMYRSDYGEVQDINRNDSTIQKDWTIFKSYQLPKEIGFAIRAHKGWDRNNEEVPFALTVSIEVLNANVPIYELIRIENEIEIPIRV
ncbi:MAG TPA: S8 family peptidase [Prolixibacteraceae bacterium]|nr:S8 family peptidase [Prolixibacteraceae bacterium]